MKPRIIVSTKNAREDITTIQEMEKMKRDKEKAKQNRKRVIRQFNKNYQIKQFDRYYSNVSLTDRPNGTTTVDRIVIIVNSIYSQTFDDIGKIALTTISKILRDTALVRENRLNEM
jgi:hypothetical protein